MRALLISLLLTAACAPVPTPDDDDPADDDDLAPDDDDSLSDDDDLAPDDDDLAPDDDDLAPDDDDSSPTDAVQEGPEITCDAPVAGIDRFTEQAVQRGVTPTLEYTIGPRPCFEVVGSVVSTDLDADGDIDLMFHSRDGFPQIYANDGTGHFSAAPVDHDVRGRFGRAPLAFSAVDLDGDGLPEVVVTGANLAIVSHNLGGMTFSDWEVIWDEPAYPRTCFNTMVWGDIDADGDLDLFLPGIDPVPDDQWTIDFENEDDLQIQGTTEQLIYRDGDAWSAPVPMHQGADGGDGLSILGFFTDRDDDGDLDLFVSSDRPAPWNPPSAFFRNDGGPDRPSLVNDAGQLGADIRINGMGLGDNDINGDGALDYCITDVADRIACLLSDGQGGWFEAGAAIGLTIGWARTPDPNRGGDVPSWSGWGLELVDLDNDGALDMAAVAGGSPGNGMEDALWRGLGDGTFEEVSHEVGFDDIAPHFGLTSDDFDGDGYRDLVTSGWSGEATFFSNPCGAGAWVEIELVGPPGNREGFGARVEVTAGGRVDRQEVHALRSLGQSSSRIHVGLGSAAAIDRLEVRWADGQTTVAEGLGVRRLLTVRHPEAS